MRFNFKDLAPDFFMGDLDENELGWYKIEVVIGEFSLHFHLDYCQSEVVEFSLSEYEEGHGYGKEMMKEIILRINGDLYSVEEIYQQYHILMDSYAEDTFNAIQTEQKNWDRHVLSFRNPR